MSMSLDNGSWIRSQPSTLSDDTIPSVKGEWYNYCSIFTPNRPLGYLMKCKANKDRAWSFVEVNPDVDIIFMFGKRSVRICSPHSKLSVERMSSFNVSINTLNKSLITRIGTNSGIFDEMRNLKDKEQLASICRSGHGISQMAIHKDMVISIITQTGKYGLMRVVEVTPEMVRLDMCHILI